MKRIANQRISMGSIRKGFLKVPQALLDDLYSRNDDTRCKALVYLCLLRHAYFVEGSCMLNGQRITCHKGEWITTYRELEEKTQVSKSRLKLLLETLAMEGKIMLHLNNRYTLIQIKETPYTGTVIPTEVSALPVQMNERPNYKRFKD